MRIAIAVASLAGVVVGQVQGQEVVGRSGTSFSITEKVAAGDWVRIASPNGTIRITQGGGSQVEFRAEKVIRRGEPDDVGFVVRRENGGLTICAVFEDADECDEDGDYHSRDRGRNWWRDHQARINLTVRIPDGVRLKVGSGNGDVSVSGASTEVVASSGNGKVTIDGAAGPVDASSGNGDILVTTGLGPVNASTGNGTIDVSMARLTGSPDMSFSTGNGAITVSVPEGFGAELRSNTGNGRVSVDIPMQVRGKLDPSRLRGTIGKGGGRLVMTSGNGDLEIVTRR